VNIEINDILPEIQAKTINYDDIKIPLEIIDRECDKVKEKVNFEMKGGGTSKDGMGSGSINPAPIMQPVKAVCVLLNDVVTIEVVNSLNLFIKACDEWNTKVKVSSPAPLENRLSLDPLNRRTKIIGDLGSTYSFVEVVPARLNRRSSLDDAVQELVLLALERVTDSVRCLVEMYSKSFPVSFRMREMVDRGRTEVHGGKTGNFKLSS